MKISEVNIDFIKPNNGLIAFASIVLDDSIYLGNIGVMKRIEDNSYRLIYPTRKMGDRNMNVYHPINTKTGMEIEEIISNKIKEVLNNHDRYYNNIDTSNE